MKSTDLRLARPQLEQLVLHQLARLDVERRERLVHQQDLRVEDQHLRERDALPHSARQLVRVAVLEAREADARQPVARLRFRGIPAPCRGIRSPAMTFASALRHGISASAWNM